MAVGTSNEQPVVLRIGMNATLDKEATDLIMQIANQFSEAGFDPRPTKISDDDWTHKVTTGKAVGEFDLVIGKWSFGLDENVNDLFYTRDTTQFTGTRNIFNYSNTEIDTILDEYTNARTEDPARNAYRVYTKLAQDSHISFFGNLDTKSAWRKEIRKCYYYSILLFYRHWSLEVCEVKGQSLESLVDISARESGCSHGAPTGSCHHHWFTWLLPGDPVSIIRGLPEQCRGGSYLAESTRWRSMEVL